VRVGTELPFARGADLLAVLAGMRCSASTVRALTEAAGAALVAIEEDECTHIQRTLPASLPAAERHLVSVDGAMVPLVGGEWREVRTLVIGELGPADDPERQTRALSYVSRMTDAQTFADLALGEVHRRGTDQARTVAAVADGAPWCQQFFDYHVPHAVRILDFPHAVEHLSHVAQSVFERGTAATSDWVGTQRHRLRQGERDAVLAAIATLPVATAPQPADAAQARDRELAYFTTRWAQIDYARFVADGLPIGSGAVESANKLVVEARLKGAGMHWSPVHVNAMLALRCALCSDRWDERWQTLAAARPVATPPIPPAPLFVATAPPVPPAPVRVALPRVPHQPTIVAGKPTIDHPWKRGLALRNPRPPDDDC
jgi:hypothetical protein